MKSHLLKVAATTILAAGLATQCLADDQPEITLQAVKHDTSPPLSDLVRQWQDKRDSAVTGTPPTEQVYVVPNILEIDELGRRGKPDGKETTPGTIQRGATRGLSAPPLEMSFDGYGADDNRSLFGGSGLPPDTNGDVGANFYIHYVNTGWAIYNKADGSLFNGPFAGNTFWQGFGGVCETNNAGDPIVLYDKLAERWVFSQFTSPNNPDGSQCFAVSTTSDPLGSYHRYQFTFPGVFNDYPHIGIWNDASGANSGYYFVTHDFTLNPTQFRQASFSVVDRDRMLNGESAAFVRFTDTSFAGFSAFGAQPAHLESTVLPPEGERAPIVLSRPDLDGYLFWQLCPDWSNPADSSLSSPVLVDANATWNTAVSAVPQPDNIPGNELDTLSGRVMYRASYRAYPSASGLPGQMLVTHTVNAGDGRAAFRWVSFALPGGDQLFAGGFEDNEEASSSAIVIENQGVFAPDSENRWMPSGSIDQNGNIAIGYSIASQTVLPGVRYTGRQVGDPENVLRTEVECVAGGGVQQFVDGGGRPSRWGDYASTSIDPDDQCKFWHTSEYYAITGNVEWENRVCTFSFADCGNADFQLRRKAAETINQCALERAVPFRYELFALNGFADSVALSGTGATLPPGVDFEFSNSNPGAFPQEGKFELTNLGSIPSGLYPLTLSASSASPAITRTLDYQLVVSADITSSGAELDSPVNGAADVGLVPTFEWSPVPGALSYRIEISADPAFTSIVETAEVAGTSFTPAGAFDTNTQFFWRVTGLNNCGVGAASAVSSFTTGSFVTGTAADCGVGQTANIVFFDDMDSGAGGWTTPAAPVGDNTWSQVSDRAFSGSAWFAVDPETASDQYLVSPSITLPGAAEQPISLAYWNFQNMESNTGQGADACWDGGLLEVSNDGGDSWVQIAGGDILSDPYNGPITVNAASPISGLDAWCADASNGAGGSTVDIAVIDLNSLAGQTVRFRYRLGSDGAVGREGWYVDNVTVQSCQ